MGVDTNASFFVYHGTVGERTDISAGLSGHPAYDNLTLDPFYSLGYSEATPDGLYRVSVWNVESSDIRPFYGRKNAGIKRLFSQDEKQGHMIAFRRALETAPNIPKAKSGRSIERIIADEELRTYGLPGEKLALILEFTPDQREYLLLQPLIFEAAILHSVDTNEPLYSIDEMEELFFQSFPDIEQMRMFDSSEELLDGQEKSQLLIQMFRQSLAATARMLQTGDDLSFQAGDLITLQNHKLLDKDIEYYRDRVKGRDVWESMFHIAKQFEKDFLDRYPEFSFVIGRK